MVINLRNFLKNEMAKVNHCMHDTTTRTSSFTSSTEKEYCPAKVITKLGLKKSAGRM
jgi:hypothetical protein